ncbi:MAG: SDR family oxidoreductase [Gammaproteobacteria bacterium]|nr:SDR family oxidoreductase [Gammaproteobacteria bacterium]MDH5271506.1 SDR family oxidoreductase [Gammaproteobacteria bacterium]
MFESFAARGNVLIQGASRGIGLEFVRQCLAESRVGQVVATCRSPANATELAALAITAAGRLTVLALDVTDEASIAAAAAATARTVPRLHVVVNCAGVLHDDASGLRPEKRLTDVRPGSLARAFAVNAIGPLLVARHFEPLLAHADRAVFASLSARVGSIEDNRLGGWYAYRASKAAQNMYTRTLAVEWARSRRNVICVALHPGTTDTDLSRPFQGNVPEGKLFDVQRTVSQLLEVINRLRPDDTGRFFAWDGERIPW